MSTLNRKTHFRQSGLASVELALITPFLLVTLLMTAEFTRVFYDYNTLTKGVRDAARLAAEDAYDGTDQFELTNTKISNARNLVVFGNIAGTGSPLLNGMNVSQVTVLQRDLGSAPLVREHVEVTINYPYRPFVISGMGFLPEDVDTSFTLTASSTMRAL